MTNGFVFSYAGFSGCDSHCTLEIVGNLVIAAEADDNPGTSVTNMAEDLATLVCAEFDINPDQLIWIEHYPDRGHLTDDWDIVTFKRSTTRRNSVTRFRSPRWHSSDEATVEHLKRVCDPNHGIIDETLSKQIEALLDSKTETRGLIPLSLDKVLQLAPLP